jgi:hypothetical protein
MLHTYYIRRSIRINNELHSIEGQEKVISKTMIKLLSKYKFVNRATKIKKKPPV